MFIRTVFTKGLRFIAYWIHDPKALLKKTGTAITVLREDGMRGVAKRLEERGIGTYDSWSAYLALTADDLSEAQAFLSRMPRRPRIAVLLAGKPGPDLERSIRSIEAQIYPEYDLITGSATVGALFNQVRTEFFCILNAGDELTEDALLIIADSLARDPEADLLYSDEDTRGPGARLGQPFLKPAWSPDLLRSQNYASRLAVVRTEVARHAGGLSDATSGAEGYDLSLRLCEALPKERIRHLPFVLYHRKSGAETETVLAAEREALRRHLARSGRRAEVQPGRFGTHRVRYELPAPAPLVSLIICTKDRVDLLRQTVEGIRKDTDYPSLEIIIVNNRSSEPATFSYFDELKRDSRIRILDQDIPFNFSRLNNAAARIAKGSVIGLLNNDLEIIHRDWLQEMVSHAIRPEVGGVGAKLYYPQDRIQHGGVVLGIGGIAGHSHKHALRSSPGHGRRLGSVQNYSAVTAACMLMRREVFEEVGGLNEDKLAVAFNDIDLCLRIREKGYWLVWTPYAELYHHESASRGPDSNDATFMRFNREVQYMVRRWGEALLDDPFYSPNLTMVGEDFGFSFPPRVTKPWKRV